MRKALSRRRVEISRAATSRTRRQAAHAATSSGAATASRKSSTSVGSRQPKWPTRPVRSAAASTVWSSVPASSSSSVSPACSETTRTPGRPPAHPGSASGTTTRRTRPASRRRSSRHRTRGDHAAAGQDADRVAQPFHEVELVAGEDDGDTLPALVEQGRGERVDTDRVEPGERLVEDEHLRPADQRRRQLHPLLVAERQLLDPVAAPLGDAEALDPVGRGPGGGGRVQAVQPGEVGDLLVHPHLRVEAALLRHVADPAAGRDVEGRPCQRTSPASARARPIAMRIVVVFPAPFAPQNPNIEPGATVKPTPSRTWLSP